MSKHLVEILISLFLALGPLVKWPLGVDWSTFGGRLVGLRRSTVDGRPSAWPKAWGTQGPRNDVLENLGRLEASSHDFRDSCLGNRDFRFSGAGGARARTAVDLFRGTTKGSLQICPFSNSRRSTVDGGPSGVDWLTFAVTYWNLPERTLSKKFGPLGQNVNAEA